MGSGCYGLSAVPSPERTAPKAAGDLDGRHLRPRRPQSYGRRGRWIWLPADVAAGTLGAGYCHAHKRRQEAQMYDTVTAAMAQAHLVDLHREAEHARLARVARAARRRAGRHDSPSTSNPRSA
jgi:hypothetical protein